ncbi:hypothetical protein ACFVH6_23710 [Spirillospora sp. NPDC127200]
MTYQEKLATYGVNAAQRGLIQILAENEATARLDGLEEQPVETALQNALSVVADAFTRAMEINQLSSWAVNVVEDHVRDDVGDLIEQHMQLRVERAARSSELPAEGGAADEQSAGEGPPGG